MGETILANALCNVQSYTSGIDWLQKGIDYFLPMTKNLILIAAIVEAVAGLMVLLGLEARIGAIILALYLIPVTFFFHHFWFLMGDDKAMQTIHFLKNLAIFGGLLMVVVYGSGPKRPKTIEIEED
jgi:putative oxidoreductase